MQRRISFTGFDICRFRQRSVELDLPWRCWRDDRVMLGAGTDCTGYTKARSKRRALFQPLLLLPSQLLRRHQRQQLERWIVRFTVADLAEMPIPTIGRRVTVSMSLREHIAE